MTDKADMSGAHELRKTLGGWQYFAIAVGCMIGIGWITVLGAWLDRAGAVGAVAGFVCGGIVMAGVAACYAELMSVMPHSGGDVVFAERVFGRATACLVGWCLVLVAVSVASFEALSFVWVAESLMPALAGDPLYQVFGVAVTKQQLVIGCTVLVAMYLFNRVGVSASAHAQWALTSLKLVIILAFVCVGLAFGDCTALAHSSTTSNASLSGVLWIAATCAFWLGGFQVISQAAEERRSSTSLRTVALITVGSVALGLLFYVGVVLAAAASAPREVLVSAALPAATAAERVFGSKLAAAAVLVAGLCGIVATLNAMLISGSRLLLALARLGYVPPTFGMPDRHGVPTLGLTVITTLAACGVFLGKGLLLPVVNTASMSLILCYALMCAAVLRLRTMNPGPRPFRLPGGKLTLWLLISAVGAMAAFILIEPALHWRGVPVEWILLSGWIAAGLVLWFLRRASITQVAQAAPGSASSAGVKHVP